MQRFFIIISSLFILNNLASISPYTSLTNEENTIDLGKFRDYTSEEVKSYYKDLNEGISGEELLSSLEVILKTGQKEVSKSNGGTTWDYYVLFDRDFEKDPLTEEEITNQDWKRDNVICSPLYDDTFTFVKANKPGNNVNREHVFPKSYGFGNKNDDSFLPLAATDMHNLHMGEAKNNQQGHNNYPYGNVANKETATAIKSSISGNVTGYLGENKDGIPVYEPMDKDKGDIARSIFYMAARYHTYDATLNNSPALKLSDTPTDVYTSKKTIVAAETENNPCEYGILSDLLEWNVLDPVDDHEIHRNNLVYTVLQNNRNPFIDYPNWAEIAFKTFDTGISKENPSQVGIKTTPETPENPDEPNEPIEPDTPSDPEKDDIPWYEDLENPKYFPYYGVAALVLLAFIVSLVCAKNKKKKKSTSKKKKTTSTNNSKTPSTSDSSSKKNNGSGAKKATTEAKKSNNTKK
jgi:endonuclease I